MSPHPPTHRPLLTLAAAALALALAGCGTPASQGAAAQAAGTPSATSTATASPAPSAATDVSQPTATSSPAPTVGAPVPAAPAGALSSFTFPGGTYSFEHPQDWTVEGFHSVEAPVTSATATVRDAGGRTMATVYVGGVADIVTTTAERTVYETVPVPGLASLPAPQAHLSWFREDSSYYRLQLTSGRAVAGAAPAGDVVGLIRTNEGVLTAEATWDTPFPFASEEAAKAWYASAEGRQLRALLLSVRAS